MLEFVLVMGLAVLLMLFRTPIYVAFLISSIVGVYFFVDVPFITVIQNMYSSMDKFALMAVPFFIFAADVMTTGGMATRLVNWVSALFGGVRGKLGVTTVVSANLFGAMSGSSPATVAAMGKILYPFLHKSYGEKFSAGLLTSVGAISIIIPPSISMILYGITANVSVGDLFIAGIVPGIVMGLFILVYVVFYVYKNKIKDEQGLEKENFWKLTRETLWALGVPTIVIGGIYSGLFTPTESAAIAAIYALLVSLFAYREVKLADVVKIAVSSSLLTAKIFILVAASSFFSYFLSLNQIPQEIASFMDSFNMTPLLVLLVINIILLIVGMFIEPNSAILIFTPLFIPIVQAAGIDLVHFGIILTVNLAIGMFTPPFGLNIFVASSTLKMPISKIIPGLVPFIMISLLALAVTSIFPQLSLLFLR